MADQNVVQLSRFLPFAKAFEPFVNKFSALGFPSLHLPQHSMRLSCSFPQFVAELYVCRLLHCAVTLPLTLVAVGLHCQSMLCVDSPLVTEEPCAYTRQVAVQI